MILARACQRHLRNADDRPHHLVLLGAEWRGLTSPPSEISLVEPCGPSFFLFSAQTSPRINHLCAEAGPRQAGNSCTVRILIDQGLAAWRLVVLGCWGLLLGCLAAFGGAGGLSCEELEWETAVWRAGRKAKRKGGCEFGSLLEVADDVMPFCASYASYGSVQRLQLRFPVLSSTYVRIRYILSGSSVSSRGQY